MSSVTLGTNIVLEPNVDAAPLFGLTAAEARSNFYANNSKTFLAMILKKVKEDSPNKLATALRLTVGSNAQNEELTSAVQHLKDLGYGVHVYPPQSDRPYSCPDYHTVHTVQINWN